MYFPSKWGKISHPKEELYSSPMVSSHTGRYTVCLHINCETNCSSNQPGHKDIVRGKLLMHQHLDKVFPGEEIVYMR